MTIQILTLILGTVFSGAVLSFLQYLISRSDTKKNSNKEILEKIAVLEAKIDENQAKLCRTHILRFSDELRNGISHSEEYFRQQLLDCEFYESYCEKNPSFKNGLTELSSKFIRETYLKLLEEKKL